QHSPKDGSVNIVTPEMNLVGLSLAGPSARDVLSQLTNADVSSVAFKFMDIRRMDIAGAPCIVNRITFTGDLGYEIWMAPAYQRSVYRAIKQAGSEFDIRDFGVRALLSMRLEKNFPTWANELRPIYGPFEADLGRFVKLDKGNFIGKDAAQAEFDAGPERKRVSFVIDANRADVMGDEPIWAKTSIDYGHIDQPHGFGGKRYDANAKVCTKRTDTGSISGEWRVVGWVTSGGYAHHIKASIAQGYVPTDLSNIQGDGSFEIEILGERRSARIQHEPPFDPDGARMRG
ncbi:MAG: aminomethyltransferase family protein, partial [Pseudomonadota bacterium]